MSEVIHKETIANYGLKKSEQKEGKIFLIKEEIWKIVHICKNKNYRVIERCKEDI